jgi:energy-coupling factor transport system permease protein
MLKDVTLGRYYPTSSALHSLDPRTKLFGLLVYIVLVFLAQDLSGLILCLASLILLMILSNVPFKYVLRGLRPILLVVFLADILNILFVKDGLKKAIYLTLRLFEVIWGSNLLCTTTKPKDISAALEKSLGFLKKLGVPVHDFATMIVLALRFIPILSNEALHIMEAQKARGADFESGNLVRRAKALFPLIIPLFVSAFRKADSLAIAMDSRLYGSGESSVLKPLKYGVCDFVAYIIIFVVLTLGILARIFPCHLI